MPRTRFDGIRNDLLDIQGAAGSYAMRLRQLDAPLPGAVRARLVAFGAHVGPLAAEARALQLALAPYCGPAVKKAA